MKRLLALFLVTILLSGCDDGNLTQVSFAFNNNLAGVCGSGTSAFFIHKTQDNRALIVQIPESNFSNFLTADLTTQPLPLNINGSSIRLIYREYSGPITASDLCSVVPISDPIVVREQEATAGIIKITTTAIKTAPDANGATKITHFQHTLTFSNLTFDLGDGNSQVNEVIAPISFQTAATAFSNFSNLTGVKSCTPDDTPDNTFLFKFDATQALVLDLSDEDAASLFSNEPGPKTAYFSANTRLTHYFFNTSVNPLLQSYFCTNPSPATPSIIDTFFAENGVIDQSGIIEVTSLESDNGYKHTIVLKKVRLAKGSLKRDLGDTFIFGEFETVN